MNIFDITLNSNLELFRASVSSYSFLILYMLGKIFMAGE